jgi:hypothetical protein
MTELTCRYGEGREDALVAFLYDEPNGSPADRTLFESHLRTCARCRADLEGLQGVRTQLARWSPPEPAFAVIGRQSSANPQPGGGDPHWWRAIPVWAQVAAAMLILGVSAGIANLDVRYDHSGLSVKTGWSGRGSDAARPEAAQGASPASAPWKADIAALESQLKNEIHAAQASTPAPSAVRAVSASSTASDAEVTRRVRALVEESEKRQQRELALRIAELLRDVDAQRKADLVKIDRTLGAVQNNVGIEVMKNRQQLNQMDLLYRASQRQ